MTRKTTSAFICVLLAAAFTFGCKPKPPARPAPPGAYFHTPFQSESQFIVEAIVSDIAEQVYFASYHRVPDSEQFLVAATEKPASSIDAPVYEIQIRLDPKKGDLKMDLKIDGPIWAPAVYQPVVEELARSVGLSAGVPGKGDDKALLSTLSDSSAETIERENEKLSAVLESDFKNSELHEKAALLLGAFLLREHSGDFFEIRSPLSRMSAHLAVAHFLRGADTSGVNGQMAEALLLTFVNDQALALERLNAVNTNDVAVAPLVRALRARNTGDYRSLAGATNRSPVESIASFWAMANYVSTPLAWPKLGDEEKHTIDFVRIANETDYSVENGHELMEVSIPLEIQEIKNIYELSHHETLSESRFTKVLNELPKHCFTSGQAHVRIIGWGQWAMFFQRHLCHAIEQDFHFMNYKWGVPEDAREFAERCDEKFGGMTLYPFVRRFNCTDVQSYHKAVDDGFKVTVATPHLVPAECWNYLCYKTDFAPVYSPNPNPHVNEWHSHNPPPGTVYDLHPRLDHPSLVGRKDAVARFEALKALAPYDCQVADFISKRKYRNGLTYEQAMALYHDVMPYSVTALRAVASTAYNKSEQYEELMVKAAELDPSLNYVLGEHALRQMKEDKAAEFYQKAYDADQDRVRASNHSFWLVQYYLKHGRTSKARAIASEGGSVYSFQGLEAQATFFETLSNYDAAFEWFEKIEERYKDSTPLICFCVRYKSQTGDQRFEPELKQRLGKMFPKGLEKVSLKDFHGAPGDGVLIRQQNDLVSAAGLRAGDVIVAVYGIRVHNFLQYSYGREQKQTPELELIVWQGNNYREVKASPPNHRFGADFGDYPGN